MSRQRTRSRRDDGFTLVELIITIGMLSLITVVVSASIIVIFRSEDGALRVTAESHDTQQGVNYFPLDVHAGPVEDTAYNTSSGASGCGVGGGVNVLRFEKVDKLVSYRLTEVDGVGRLDRYVCDYPSLANVESVNIADRLDASVSPSAVADVRSVGGIVETIELLLSQEGTDASVVASPRGEPRNSPGDCSTANPIDAAHGYGVFVEGDVELFDGEITGWLGLGGMLSWRTDFSVATGNMSGVAPIYGLYAEEINWLGAQIVSDLDVAANVATATVVGHGYAPGQQVVIERTGDTNIDGNAYSVAVVDADTFTFSVVTSNVSDLTGTARTIGTVTDLDVASNVATATVASHGYTTGDQVVIEGTGNTDIDGIAFSLTVVDADTFTFSVTTADVVDLSGTSRIVDPVALEVAREKAALGEGWDQVGDLVYESPGSPDNYLDLSGPANPQAESTAAQIDFPVDFNELRDCSAQIAQLVDLCDLAGCANPVDATFTPGSPGVVNACSSGALPQVLNVPEQYFDGNWVFDTSGPGCQGFSQARPLILNVIDCATITCDAEGDHTVNFNATSVDWQALGDRKNILFNFPNSTIININSGFWGHVLAPFAHVTTNGDIEGAVIARQWTHVDGVVDSNDDLYNNPISWP